jgi:hypothetical protein
LSGNLGSSAHDVFNIERGFNSRGTIVGTEDGGGLPLTLREEEDEELSKIEGRVVLSKELVDGLGVVGRQTTESISDGISRTKNLRINSESKARVAGDSLLSDGGETRNATNKRDNLFDGNGERVFTEATSDLDARLDVLEHVVNTADDLLSTAYGSEDTDEITSDGSLFDLNIRETRDIGDDAVTMFSRGSDHGSDLFVVDVLTILVVLGVRDSPEE